MSERFGYSALPDLSKGSGPRKSAGLSPPASPPPSVAAILPLDLDIPVGDFLDQVIAWSKVRPAAKELNEALIMLNNNGIVFARQLRELPADLFQMVGVPPELQAPLEAAFDGKPYLPPAKTSPIPSPKIPGSSKSPVAKPEEKEFGDGLPFEIPDYLKTESAGLTGYGSKKAAPISPPVTVVKDPPPPLYYEPPILEKQASDFDLCRLCRNPFADGPKEYVEPCFHICCKDCLIKYVQEKITSKTIPIPCPSAPKCSSFLSEAQLRFLLSEKDFENYLSLGMQAFMSGDDSVIVCPRKECGFAGSKPDPIHESKLARKLADVTEKDDNGKLLSLEAFKHFQQYRIRCPGCSVAYCLSCKISPYHKGFTCAGYNEYLTSRQCRFCHVKLKLENKAPKTALECCNGEECLSKLSNCCEKTLECGCPCNGVKDEEKCLPCLKCELKCSEDYCPICYVESLGDAPCIQVKCKHVFHYHCVKEKIRAGYIGARITFSFRCCPIDKVPLEHPSLEEVLAPIKALEARIQDMALQRLDYEGRRRDDEVSKPTGKYYGDVAGYAMHVYLFFMCYDCKKPYFAGGYQCQEASAGFDEKELVCPSCQPESKNVEDCPKHGKDWIAFKCRFCCQIANWFCWSKTHFCDNCHASGVWQNLVTYQTGTNKKKIWEYPQCPGLTAKIAKARETYKSLSDEKLEEKLMALVSDPKTCPLNLAHPPNGFEFGVGCTMCADKSTEESNKLAAEKAAREESEKKEWSEMIRTSKMSRVALEPPGIGEAPKGIVHYLGTWAGSREYVNPAKGWMVTVTSSDLSPGSDPGSQLCMLTAPVKFCTTNVEKSFVQLQFDERFSIAPTHIGLWSHSESKEAFPSSWSVSCSGRGSRDAPTTGTVVKKDKTLTKPGQFVVYKLDKIDKKKKFSKIRLELSPGGSTAGDNRLSLGAVEVFGVLYFTG